MGEPPESQTPQSGGAPPGIPVVALGGSAGALDSYKAFFEALPPDSGAAFVVIQHLAPSHESLLPEILSRSTPMKVAAAADGLPAEPNCVYVIPPNEYLEIRGGILRTAAPVTQGGIRMPIDFFFRSLGEDRPERSVGVLLSGTGSDGTLGVRAIRGAGGLTIAQDPGTAQYGDMPRSAIAAKLVDLVLAPEQMPQAISEDLRQPYVQGREPAVSTGTGETPGGLDEILSIVQAQTGDDFHCYKKGTMLRRIERRMVLRGTSDVGRYGALLGRDAREVGELHRDLLINVTAFFRDPGSFEELRHRVIAPTVRDRRSDEPFRVWAPGCSSGEEAYSIAMLWMEETAAARTSRPVQIFATDIDDEALEFGRRGIYPERIAADLGAGRLPRFFVRGAQGCQIGESIRKSVVFARQNLITDPPFSKMDLLCCRNLLIYLEEEAQARLMPLFNFALNPDGHLFLGKAEGVGGREDLFKLVSKAGRLYRRLPPAVPVLLDLPVSRGRKRAIPGGRPAAKPPALSHAELVRQALLDHFAACVVLTDARGQILQFHGQTGRYLDLPATEPNLNLREIAKEGLAMRLWSALHAAVDQGRTVVLDGIPITREEGAPCARVTVTPLARRGATEPLLAVIFEDVPRPAPAGAGPAPSRESEAVIRELEVELQAAQRELQISVAELQAANEEVTSTNEELETSQEELQSANEELTTVNSQLQEKLELLDAARGDLANLIAATRIATLFLDRELRVKYFTPATTSLLRLIPTDTGRPIHDLTADFVGYDLTAEARAVLESGAIAEREVRHANGSCYLVRVLPYAAEGDGVAGVVATFDDVTCLRRAEEGIRRLATVVADSGDALILFDREGSIQAWNRGAADTYGWSEAEALRMNLRDLAPADAAAETADMLGRLWSGKSIPSLEARRLTKDGRVLHVWVTITAGRDASGKVEAIASTERDVTERKRAELALKENLRLAQSNADLEHFASVASHDLQEPLRMVTSFLDLLKRRYQGRLDAAADEYISLARDGAARMSVLINDLLAFSHVDSRDQEFGAASAEDALGSAVANLQPAIEAVGATITHDELPTVRANLAQLTRVFQNLIGNAVKFQRPGRPCEVHVGARRDGGAGVFSVRDNGIGIPAGQFERVFQIFQRLNSREDYPGTGLGLAVCKRILERHGGRIWVESTVGAGSTFCFTMEDRGGG